MEVFKLTQTIETALMNTHVPVTLKTSPPVLQRRYVGGGDMLAGKNACFSSLKTSHTHTHAQSFSSH